MYILRRGQHHFNTAVNAGRGHGARHAAKIAMIKTSLLLALCLLVGASAAIVPAPASTPRDLSTYTFAQYRAEFNKHYANGAELLRREAIFAANLAHIARVNAAHRAGTKTWFATVNKFTDLEAHEMQAHKGLKKTRRGHHNVLTASSPDAPKLNFQDLPAAVDWRAKDVVTPIKNQGQCGSCWTFSTAETLESHIAIATGQLFVFSEQQIVSCAQNPQKCGGTGGCEGATQEIAFNYSRDAGMTLESSYPYQGADAPCDASQVKPVATIAGYVKLNGNNATELQAAIAQQPVAISVAAASQVFQFYGGGIAQGDCGTDVDVR